MSDAGYSTERHKYHDSTNLPRMVSLVFALQREGNTMKYTIDDADYIIDQRFYYYISMRYKFILLPLDCK